MKTKQLKRVTGQLLSHINLWVAHSLGLLVSCALTGLVAPHGLFLLLNKTAAWAAASAEEIHPNIPLDTELVAHLATLECLENPGAATVGQAEPAAAL